MSDGDNPFVRPGGWTLGDSTNPAFYPAGNNLLIGRNQIETDLFDLVWTEDSGAICYLEKVRYFPPGSDGQPAALYAPDATGYDPDGSEHVYSVWVGLIAGSQLAAVVTFVGTVAASKGTGADPGSLAGLWGADAKPPAVTTTAAATAKSLKAVK